MRQRDDPLSMEGRFHLLVDAPWWAGPICAGAAYAFLRWLTPAILGFAVVGGDRAFAANA